MPEKYRARSTRVDTGAAEPTADEQRAAQERAARLRQQVEADRRPASASPPAPAITAGSAPPAKRPPVGVTDDTDCATWRRLYEESVACFRPYRTATGGIKPEAFEHCTEIPNPDPKCGRTVH